MRLQLTGLWHHPDFLKLWAGQTISAFGSQVTLLALPLTAALQLGAGPGEMGLLRAAQQAPFLLFGLVAGVWVDRVRRRPTLIAAELGRMALLAAIPLAAAFGVLRIEQLYVLGFVVGTLTLFFTVAYVSFLPAVVGRDQLVEANSKVMMTGQVAQVAGPSLAGALVQIVTAPMAIILDALSFGMSALLMGLNRTREPAPRPAAERRSTWAEIGEGLRFVWSDRSVRALAIAGGVANLFGGALGAVYILYVTRELGITPAMLGVIMATGGAGGVLGALVAARVVWWLGLGPTLTWALLLGAADLLIPLAGMAPQLAVPLLAASGVLGSFGGIIFSVHGQSLLQAMTPEHMLGRMNATARVIIAGAWPLGALLGGALGETAGLWPTLWLVAAGSLLSLLPLWLSPVRTLQEQPTPVGAAA